MLILLMTRKNILPGENRQRQRKGKRKAEQVMDGIVLLGDNINKIVEVTEERKKEREKVTEAQLEISRQPAGCTDTKGSKVDRSLQ